MEGIQTTSTTSNGLPAVIPSWAQSEVASSQSGPQQIPPELHDKVFSWAEVKDIIGMRSSSKKVVFQNLLAYDYAYMYIYVWRSTNSGAEMQKETERLTRDRQ